MLVPVSKKISNSKAVFVFGLLLIVSLLLSACGIEQLPNATDGNYRIPVFNGGESLPAIAENQNFRNAMLTPRNTTNTANTQPTVSPFVEQNVQVYALPATTQLNTLKDYYVTEMRKLGWTNNSVNLIAGDALKTDGFVDGFVKQNHVSGIYAVAPTAKDKGILRDYAVPNDRVILIITSATRLAQ
jgi:hypothetical protein